LESDGTEQSAQQRHSKARVKMQSWCRDYDNEEGAGCGKQQPGTEA
jgi:hypothetical protein